MTPHSIETLRHLSPDDKAQLRHLAQSVELSDQALALVANAPETEADADPLEGIFLLARDDTDHLQSAAVIDVRIDPPVGEFIAAPDLASPVDWVQLVFDELTNHPPATTLAIWDHGGDTAIGRLAQARGWPISRSLVIMEAPLVRQEQTTQPAAPTVPPGATSPRLNVPAGWQLRAFDPATDEEPWLELNRQAFVDLPDQAAWTLDDLRARYQEDWFDPAGFLVLTDSEGTLQGAHWTKHEGTLGEVYVLAVAPSATGQGLGELLTNAGLAQLANDGATRVQLYVDATNAAALALYQKIGFTELARDTQYLAGLGHV